MSEQVFTLFEQDNERKLNELRNGTTTHDTDTHISTRCTYVYKTGENYFTRLLSSFLLLHLLNVAD